jgi:hypothetical protein
VEAEQRLNDQKPGQIFMSVIPVFGTNTTVELKPLDTVSLFKSTTYYHEYVLMMRFNDGNLGYCSYPRMNRFGNSADNIGFTLIQNDAWSRGIIVPQVHKVESRWNRGTYGNQDVVRQVDPTAINPGEEIYEIELTWTTEHGEFKKKLHT